MYHHPPKKVHLYFQTWFLLLSPPSLDSMQYNVIPEVSHHGDVQLNHFQQSTISMILVSVIINIRIQEQV